MRFNKLGWSIAILAVAAFSTLANPAVAEIVSDIGSGGGWIAADDATAAPSDLDPGVAAAPPPYPPGLNLAIAQYDPGSGEFWIMVKGPKGNGLAVTNWLITSVDNQELFTGPGMADLRWRPDTSPDGVLPIDRGKAGIADPATETVAPYAVGETRFDQDLWTEPAFGGFIPGYYHVPDSNPVEYKWISLGQVAEPGLPVNPDNVAEFFKLSYNVKPSLQLRDGDIIVIPEPGTVMMLVSGSFGLALVVRRRRR